MSCIIGYVDKTNGDVYIAGDSAGLLAEKLTCRILVDQKVFSKDNVIFGVAGSSRVSQVLRYIFSIPEKPNGMLDETYIYSIFIKAIINCLKDNGTLQTINDGEEAFDGYILFAYNNILYRIDPDFSCFPVKTFDVIGCGEDFSRPVLHALELLNVDSLEPLKKIELALITACEFSVGVRPPFSYVISKKITNENQTSDVTELENI